MGISLPVLGVPGLFNGGGAAVPWYLSGGINSASVVAIYEPVTAANLAASYQNVADPGTNDAQIGVAPTFDALAGWVFNGSTQYLVTPVVNHNSCTILVKFAGVSGSHLNVLFGNSIGANVYHVIPYRVTTSVRWLCGDYLNNTTPGLTSGVVGIGASIYRNGVKDTAVAITFADQAGALYLGGLNDDGVLTTPLACEIQAVAIYNTKLADEQVASVSDYMSANF